SVVVTISFASCFCRNRIRRKGLMMVKGQSRILMSSISRETITKQEHDVSSYAEWHLEFRMTEAVSSCTIRWTLKTSGRFQTKGYYSAVKICPGSRPPVFL